MYKYCTANVNTSLIYIHMCKDALTFSANIQNDTWKIKLNVFLFNEISLRTSDRALNIIIFLNGLSEL